MPTSIPKETARKLINLRMKGMKPKAIAEKLGMKRGTVCVYLCILKEERNLIYPRCSKYTFKDLEAIYKLTINKSQAQVARDLGVTGGLISQLVRRYTEIWVEKSRRKDSF